MKRMILVASVFSLVLVSMLYAAPQVDFFVNSGTETCKSEVSSAWFQLAPGEQVEYTYDVSGCLPGTFSNIIYYGYIARQASADVLKVKDDINLKLIDGQTNDVLADSHNGSLKQNEKIYLLGTINPTTKFILHIENISKNKATQKVRFSSHSLNLN